LDDNSLDGVSFTIKVKLYELITVIGRRSPAKLV
jgi:hypothetical protein